MNELSKQHKKVIYDAVRRYQMNSVPLNSKSYQLCDEILNNFFADVKIGGETPAGAISTIGEVTRQSFEVSPSTISLRYCPTVLLQYHPNCISTSGDLSTYFNIKRDTLETDDGYKCKLEDYENKNKI